MTSSPVEQWLYKYWQKKDVPAENIETISRAALSDTDALRAALSDIGITIKQNKGKLREFEKVRMTELVGLIQGTTRKDVMRATTPAFRPLHVESERHEEEKMRAAVSTAISMGLVQERVVPATKSDARHAYILASSHYDPSKGPNEQDPLMKQSQIELFQLSYLLQRERVSGCMLAEGLMNTGRPYECGRVLVPLENSQPPMLITEPHVQEHFFSNPAQLIGVMNQLLEVPGHLPMFYRLSAFPFDGSECQTHLQAGAALLKKLQRSFIFEKTISRLKTAAAKGHDGEKFQIQTRWEKGVWQMIIGNESIAAHSFAEEGEAHLQTMQEFALFDAAREKESAERLRNTSLKNIPMQWMGAAHAEMVANLLKEDMHVHILTPKSSKDFDQRQEDDAKQHIREIPFVTMLLDPAKKIAAWPAPN